MSEKAEVLVVMSKVKAYIKNKAGMNVSASVASALSEKVAAICDSAIENAQSAKRKTVMDKDI
ncbi:MAG: NFYB/HAP3 family transcription factor subunit [Spirochaetales bacterium]|nr:NFYB/HAP3 family transcription factor subunit [Spirochaetales bacterium]